jgi:hypothetical protein
MIITYTNILRETECGGRDDGASGLKDEELEGEGRTKDRLLPGAVVRGLADPIIPISVRRLRRGERKNNNGVSIGVPEGG